MVKQHEVRDSTGWLLGVAFGPLDWRTNPAEQYYASAYPTGMTCAKGEHFPTRQAAVKWIREATQ